MRRSPLEFVRPNILSLKPYSTARDEFEGEGIKIWIDANESPYPNGINRYPDPRHRTLKRRIAEIKGVSDTMIFIGGAGSDEAIDLTFRIFCNPGQHKAIIPTPTYGVYSVAAHINDVETVELPLNPDFTLPVKEIKNAADNDSDIRLIWICSPNNPTGNAFDKSDIISIADSFNGIVAVDEAYVDFSSKGSLLQDIVDHPNIVVLQTFSKAWGMAALRCGMAFAVPEIASIYNNVKYPYNLNGPTQQRILDLTLQYPLEQIKEITGERAMLAQSLTKFKCVKKVHPSDANFLLVEVSNPNELYTYLVDNGLLPRDRSKIAGCGPSLRFTIGTPSENRKLIELISSYDSRQ